jgi:membrane protein DedA with SNARE-associated domain
MPPWLALAFGTLVSEDLTTIAAGVLVGSRRLPPAVALAGCGLGIYLGDLCLWLAGRILGTRALAQRRVAAVLPVGGRERFREWFDRHPCTAILGSRFAPGTRLPLYVGAGACHTSFATFASWSLAAVVLWTPLILAASALAGARLTTWLAAGRLAVLVISAIALVGWKLTLRLSAKRARQQLLAAAARLWRWEFWPMWLFYVPVAAWTFYLSLRHGGYRTLTAANPGMPDGGVVGESKHSILTRLPAEWTIPAFVVDAGAIDARCATFIAALKTRGWTYPLVLKPDVGQRGAGVRQARNLEEALNYLRATSGVVVVQPYHAGPFEAGVFYYRMPDWRRGRILCITDKHFPAVIGDGGSTLEDLVWSHPRYRMQARTFLARLRERRMEIPASGERVSIGIAGNHAQGTMFTDGRHLITPRLEARIDTIARAYGGFYVGRFDVRYRDRSAFMDGRDLAIVELNGATAECTNVYDPSNSLLSAYRQLFRQWRLVFEIGAANRRAGHSPSSSRRLRTLLQSHLITPVSFPVSD